MKDWQDKVESKIDKLDERLDSVDKHLAVYNKQLEIHIAGVQDNRAKIQHIDKHVTKAELIFKVLGTIGLTILGAYLKQKFDISIPFIGI